MRTGLSRLRIAPHVGEACIGHVAPQIIRVYDRYSMLDERRAAMEQWGQFVMRIVNGSPDNVVPMRA